MVSGFIVEPTLNGLQRDNDTESMDKSVTY